MVWLLIIFMIPIAIIIFSKYKMNNAKNDDEFARYVPQMWCSIVTLIILVCIIALHII